VCSSDLFISDVWAKIGLEWKELGAEKERLFEEKLGTRVWETKKYAVAPKVIEYLETVLSPHREFAERTLGIKFTETP
jgi:hypothetical protein